MEKPLTVLRHNARGCLNSIKLCVSALELDCTYEEQMEFIDDVIRSSDKMSGIMGDLDDLLDAQSHTQAGQTA